LPVLVTITVLVAAVAAVVLRISVQVVAVLVLISGQVVAVLILVPVAAVLVQQKDCKI
jgi:hypothetical protein